MSTPDNDIIDKIEKLLNLASNAGTEGEAKAAFAAASKLMTKHGIEQHQVTGRSDEKMKEAAAVKEVTLNSKVYASERPYDLYIRRIIKHCFHVSIIKVRRFGRSPDYYMIGTREDCVFAAYAFDTLRTIFLKHVGAFLKAHGLPRTPRYFNGYWDGLERGFCAAWDEAQRAQMVSQGAQSYAIVLVDKDRAVDAYIAQSKDIKQVKDRRNPDGFARAVGFHDGKKISIHRPLTGGA